MVTDVLKQKYLSIIYYKVFIFTFRQLLITAKTGNEKWQ